MLDIQDKNINMDETSVTDVEQKGKSCKFI